MPCVEKRNPSKERERDREVRRAESFGLAGILVDDWDLGDAVSIVYWPWRPRGGIRKAGKPRNMRCSFSMLGCGDKRGQRGHTVTEDMLVFLFQAALVVSRLRRSRP